MRLTSIWQIVFSARCINRKQMPDNSIVIKTKMTQQDFIGANIALAYRRISTKIITAIGVLLLGYIIYLSILYPGATDTYEFIVPIGLILLPVILSYLTARLNYNTSKRSSENIEYIFSDDFFSIKGESFNSQLSWDKIYKVSQTKNWILIWHNRLAATPIPKKDLLRSDIDTLKTILDFHGVKNNL